METQNLPLRRLNLNLGSLSIRNSVIRVAPGPMHLRLPAQPRHILPSWTILLPLRCMPTLRPRYRGRQPVRLSVLYSSINSCTAIHAILHFSAGLSVSGRASFQSRVSVSWRRRCTDMLNPRALGARRLDSPISQHDDVLHIQHARLEVTRLMDLALGTYGRCPSWPGSLSLSCPQGRCQPSRRTSGLLIDLSPFIWSRHGCLSSLFGVAEQAYAALRRS